MVEVCAVVVIGMLDRDIFVRLSGVDDEAVGKIVTAKNANCKSVSDFIIKLLNFFFLHSSCRLYSYYRRANFLCKCNSNLHTCDLTGRHNF